MASTYTPLGVELMATGENAGTWGTKTNTNLQIIEQLAGGYTTQAVTSGGTVNLSSYYNDTLVFPCFSGNSSSASCSFNVNFGNGYFGTTAVSSAGTNASNIGIFEYDVPTNFTALSTKGLNL